MSGAITLGAVAERAAMLALSCNVCDRRGRLSVRKLVAQHGAELPIPVLLAKLTADCPKRAAASYNEHCGAYCPELPRLF